MPAPGLATGPPPAAERVRPPPNWSRRPPTPPASVDNGRTFPGVRHTLSLRRRSHLPGERPTRRRRDRQLVSWRKSPFIRLTVFKAVGCFGSARLLQGGLEASHDSALGDVDGRHVEAQCRGDLLAGLAFHRRLPECL